MLMMIFVLLPSGRVMVKRMSKIARPSPGILLSSSSLTTLLLVSPGSTNTWPIWIESASMHCSIIGMEKSFNSLTVYLVMGASNGILPRTRLTLMS